MVRSSLNSIERVGAKLSYSDFKEYLKQVANAFPSGTEEYAFLSDLLLSAKTDVAFKQKFFSLLGEEPKITDSAPYGFSWELQAPTDIGKAIFKKLEEVDETSAHDLYEFLSYVQLNYQSGEGQVPEPATEEPVPEPAAEEATEEPAPIVVNPDDVVDAEEDKDKLNQAAPAAVSPVFLAGGTKVYRAETFAQFQSFFPEAFGMGPEDYAAISTTGGPSYVLVKEGQAPVAFHSEAGLVDGTDANLSIAQAAELFGDDFKIIQNQIPELRGYFVRSGAPVEGGDPEEDEKKRKGPVNGFPPKSMDADAADPVAQARKNAKKKDDEDCTDSKKKPVHQAATKSPVVDVSHLESAERLSKLAPHIHPGTIVLAVRRITGGQVTQSVGQIVDHDPVDPKNVDASAHIMWSDGTRSEIPMRRISTVLFNSLNQSGAKLAVVSSYREVNGKVSFMLSGLEPSKVPNAYQQVFSGKVEMTKEQFVASKVSSKTRLYSGKALVSLFNSLSGLEGSLTAVPKFRFGKTFISEKAAVVVKSGPYGVFAVKTPVVYVKSSPRYTLFKKVGDQYISQSGHRFKSILAAAYGKPTYLMVANASKAHFKTQGKITCDAHRVLERTQFILQRKAVRAAIVSQQKALEKVILSRKKIASAVEAMKAEKENLIAQNVTQAETIKTLGARLVKSAKEPTPVPEGDANRLTRIASNADVIARRMSGLTGR